MPPNQQELALPLIRAAIDHQLSLWDALRVAEVLVGERAVTGLDDIVQELAIACDRSSAELADEEILSRLPHLARHRR